MKVKCQYCQEKQERQDMLFIYQNKVNKVRKYYHPECYPKHLKNEKKKKKEQKYFNKIILILKDIHDVEFLPSSILNNIKKRKKENMPKISFELIYECYQQNLNLIKTQINKKKRQGSFKNFNSEIFYGFAIMENQLADMLNKKKKHKKMKKDQSRKKEDLNIIKDMEDISKIKNITDNKKEEKLDLTDIF